MDRIYIRDLKVPCIIGTRPREREAVQDLLINLELECDLSAAGKSDRIEDTVNYSDLRHAIVRQVQAGRYFLIERAAEVVAGLCLADPRVTAATVTIDKPAALDEARSAAVSIRRGR